VLGTQPPRRFSVSHPHRQSSALCSDIPNAVRSMKPRHPAIFFLLRKQCALKYSLKFNSRVGLTLAPVVAVIRRRGGDPVVAVADTASTSV